MENMKEHSYLGITIAQSMSFIPHINNVTCKATKVLNFIECNLYNDVPSYIVYSYTKSNAYLVRPSLEYAGSVWDHYY